MKTIFSICLCCYNDLPYLKLLFKSLKKHTTIPYEISIFDNNSSDGTWDWLMEQKGEMVGKLIGNKGAENEGVSAVNHAVKASRGDYIVNCNADHYFLPGWDMNIIKYLRKYSDNMYSFNVIEPSSENYKYIFFDAGKAPKDFREDDLIKFYRTNVEGKVGKNIISISHPVACTRRMWDKIGGVDDAYFPGWSSDIAWSAKAYKLGAKQIMCRSSVVYHFISSTLNRPEFNKKRKEMAQKGEQLFKNEFGILPEEWKLTINDGEVYNGE